MMSTKCFLITTTDITCAYINRRNTIFDKIKLIVHLLIIASVYENNRVVTIFNAFFQNIILR